MIPFTLNITPFLSVDVSTREAAQKIAIAAVENVAAEFGLDYVKTCIKVANPNATQALRFLELGYKNDPSAALAALFCEEEIVESSDGRAAREGTSSTGQAAREGTSSTGREGRCGVGGDDPIAPQLSSNRRMVESSNGKVIEP